MKTYTIEDIKSAFEDGYYDGAGDDAWYRDYDDDGELIENAYVHTYLKEYLKDLLKGEEK